MTVRSRRRGIIANRTAAAARLTETWASYTPNVNWPDGTTHGPWTVQYGGFGTVQCESDSGTQRLCFINPAVSDPGTTHAANLTTTATFSGNIDITVTARTVAQTRTPTPNPWEVPWLLWHYTDDSHFYSLNLKPNGWELGKEDPAYPGEQRYLDDAATPTFAIGSWHTFRISQVGTTITAWGNGTLLTTVTDSETPYTSGSVAMYNEDSHVHFGTVTVV